MLRVASHRLPCFLSGVACSALCSSCASCLLSCYSLRSLLRLHLFLVCVSSWSVSRRCWSASLPGLCIFLVCISSLRLHLVLICISISPCLYLVVASLSLRLYGRFACPTFLSISNSVSPPVIVYLGRRVCSDVLVYLEFRVRSEFRVHLEFVRSSKKYDNPTKIARCTNTQTQGRVAGRRACRPRVFACLCVRAFVWSCMEILSSSNVDHVDLVSCVALTRRRGSRGVCRVVCRVPFVPSPLEI